VYEFDTPRPTHLSIRLAAGDVTVTAADVTKTTVDIQAMSGSDERAAEVIGRTTVEQHGDDNGRQYARQHEALDRGNTHDFERVGLLADFSCAKVRTDRRTTHSGDHQRADEWRRLADHHKSDDRAAVAFSADLAGKRSDRDRDRDAQRDHHQHRRQAGHRGEEPGLVQKLPPRELAPDN